MDDLKKILSKIDTSRPDNCMELYFSHRISNGENIKYVTHKPAISSDVQNEIWRTMFSYVNTQLAELSLVEYRPEGALDGELESISMEAIPAVDVFMQSLTKEKIKMDLSSLKVQSIDFYCVKITVDSENLYLYRQFPKMKRIRKGFITSIIDNELNVINNDILGIDGIVDMIGFNDTLYLLNHISLERIFNYRDEFLKKTKEALGQILSENVIENIELFTSDCVGDIRVMKRFTSIMTKERLPLFFENYERVVEIVTDLELDIQFTEDGRLIYREKSQLFHIINLMSDSYFKSLIAQRTGVALAEGQL
ncbi:DUF4868 domain-containing protein [Bengtsoniella intestinalis]|uniref:Kiwa anti-phage protein KwaB-like domain-containing protein n=1 Tax=Bengtsoniella intestinalis TaxID=3073143 RepID=UPI00391F047A